MPTRTLYVVLLAWGLLALLAGCGVPTAAPTVVVHAPTLTPTFTRTAEPTATRTPTPRPTVTPAPTHTPTRTPTPRPTVTPVPIHTPTPRLPTVTPTLTASPTPLPPTATVTPVPPTVTPPPTSLPPTATRQAEDAFAFDITMQRMLSIDENAGVVGNHNIYVQVFNANGDPLNGVVVCRVYALRMEPPDPHACRISGEAGPGRLHFDVFSGDVIYVATVDPEHRPLSPFTRRLEQQPANMENLQELVDNGYCESVQDCEDRIPKNLLVRFHYSYEVHFERRW